MIVYIEKRTLVGFFFFFFNDPAPTEIYSLPLPAALPIFPSGLHLLFAAYFLGAGFLLIRLLLGTARAASLLQRASPEQGFVSSLECACPVTVGWRQPRSEEHTSELQSRLHLVCRLLLEKK